MFALNTISNAVSLWRPVMSASDDLLGPNYNLAQPRNPNIDHVSLRARTAVVTGLLFAACFKCLNRFKNPVDAFHPALRFVAFAAVPAFAKMAYKFEYARALSALNQKAVETLRTQPVDINVFSYMARVPSALDSFFKTQMKNMYRKPDLLATLLSLKKENSGELFSVYLQSFKVYISKANIKSDDLLTILKHEDPDFAVAAFKEERIKEFSNNTNFVFECWTHVRHPAVARALVNAGFDVNVQSGEETPLIWALKKVFRNNPTSEYSDQCHFIALLSAGAKVPDDLSIIKIWESDLKMDSFARDILEQAKKTSFNKPVSLDQKPSVWSFEPAVVIDEDEGRFEIDKQTIKYRTMLIILPIINSIPILAAFSKKYALLPLPFLAIPYFYSKYAWSKAAVKLKNICESSLIRTFPPIHVIEHLSIDELRKKRPDGLIFDNGVTLNELAQNK